MPRQEGHPHLVEDRACARARLPSRCPAHDQGRPGGALAGYAGERDHQTRRDQCGRCREGNRHSRQGAAQAGSERSARARDDQRAVRNVQVAAKARSDQQPPDHGAGASALGPARQGAHRRRASPHMGGVRRRTLRQDGQAPDADRPAHGRGRGHAVERAWRGHLDNSGRARQERPRACSAAGPCGEGIDSRRRWRPRLHHHRHDAGQRLLQDEGAS